ncbi:glycosyltransferase [Aquabacterium sp. OR-4]|uniref:glycosyltransferase n=1 Tax=Aquabacterium sp. OR-4 TaxID=2978127 RepID=UPI0028C6FE06|nr:glycosyltransferase [Aquabacterium sp. OR-4]MDT7834475.1 glycosyltransferase [Aquabacterium sp. OR-4]
MRLVLFGDGESPHLLKWARALAPEVELWAASSRGFLPGFDGLVPESRRLSLGTTPQFKGGNFGLLKHLPALTGWLERVKADWIHAHYLTSHGTLAWLATRWLGAPGRLVGSAWGSDILVTPKRGGLMRWVTCQVLKACALTTSDSDHMAWHMRALGAGEVMTFPFGLETLPALPSPEHKQGHVFFANRGLEAVYAPQRVLAVFAAVAAEWPGTELVMANTGSMRAELERLAEQAKLKERIKFVGRLDAAAQARHYARARWYLSLPTSDSVAVSVLEAMAHGCIPILSDLPANHELVRPGENGLILPAGGMVSLADLQPLLKNRDAIAQANHDWVAAHAMFMPWVQRFLARLREIDADPTGHIRAEPTARNEPPHVTPFDIEAATARATAASQAADQAAAASDAPTAALRPKGRR